MDGGASSALIIGAIGGVSAGATYLSSSAQAKAQEEYAEDVYAAQNTAIGANQQLAADAAGIEKAKIQNQAHLIRQRIRASTGEAGLATSGGSYEAMLRQTDYDEFINVKIVEQNLANRIKSIASGRQPVNLQPISPFLDALQAGVGGASSGLQIAGAV